MFAFFVLCYFSAVEARLEKIIPLQPVQAALVSDVLSEPSGLTFCNTTKHLYAICDHTHCNYIYEINPSGEVVRKIGKLSLPLSHTCDRSNAISFQVLCMILKPLLVMM